MACAVSKHRYFTPIRLNPSLYTYEKKLALSGIVVALTGFCAFAGDVTGKVTLQGTPPPEKTIAFDDTCSALHPTVTTTRHYVVGKDNGLANVFVYISKGLEGKKFTPLFHRGGNRPGRLQVSSLRHRRHGWPGGEVQEFGSAHAQHSCVADRRRQPGVQFRPAQPGRCQRYQMDRQHHQAEVLVKIKCEVHNWMFCYVGVQDTRFSP